LERIRKEEVVAYFKVLLQHSLGGAEKNHDKTIRIAGPLAEI
jgi:hypothetical protein